MLSAVSSPLAVRLPVPDRRHVASSLVLATLALLYLFAGVSLASLDVSDGRANARGVLPVGSIGRVDLPREVPPVPEPLAFRDMTMEEAATYNASIPVSSLPNPAARAFVFDAASENDRLRALDCLTAAVYYEAAIETGEGQRAVAQVVLNRVRHPAYPKTVCGVVFEGSSRATGCQFTFTCDGSMARAPSEAGWARARKVAEEALAGKVYKPVGYATHYHTYWVVPYWSGSLTKLANVGSHIFYRWEGGWGRPSAFAHRASGTEPEISLMKHLSSVPIELAEGDPPLDPALAIVDNAAPVAGVDGRVVVRRYEPLREQAAASAKADLARSDVPKSLRWALTGSSEPAKPAVADVKGSSVPAATVPAVEQPAAKPANQTKK